MLTPLLNPAKKELQICKIPKSNHKQSRSSMRLTNMEKMMPIIPKGELNTF